MNKRIIYKTNDGNLAVIIPATTSLTIEQLASKDVPNGLPFKIVDVSEIPTDRTFRSAWDAAEDDLTDGVGGPEGVQQ